MAKETKAILRDIVEVLTALTVFGILLWLFLTLASVVFGAARAEEGVGRATTCLRAQEAEEEYESAAEETEALRRYVEGEGDTPDWYRPDEPMAVEWEEERIAAASSGPRNDEEGNAHPAEWEKPKNADLVLAVEEEPEVVTRDIGCPDWNADSTMYGWDGHSMEAWEMDLFARVFYLEFWQPDMVLCEAGCDAILQLWDLNGGTMFDTLSAITENGAYAFSTWPDVWATEYDADGLAWCRAYCEERFYSGPEWIAQYFRKGYYHDWGEWSPDPAYEIGGIFFSVARG